MNSTTNRLIYTFGSLIVLILSIAFNSCKPVELIDPSLPQESYSKIIGSYEGIQTASKYDVIYTSPTSGYLGTIYDTLTYQYTIGEVANRDEIIITEYCVDKQTTYTFKLSFFEATDAAIVFGYDERPYSPDYDKFIFTLKNNSMHLSRTFLDEPNGIFFVPYPVTKKSFEGYKK